LNSVQACYSLCVLRGTFASFAFKETPPELVWMPDIAGLSRLDGRSITQLGNCFENDQGLSSTQRTHMVRNGRKRKELMN
jgi:hypothetical protein